MATTLGSSSSDETSSPPKLSSVQHIENLPSTVENSISKNNAVKVLPKSSENDTKNVKRQQEEELSQLAAFIKDSTAIPVRAITPSDNISMKEPKVLGAETPQKGFTSTTQYSQNVFENENPVATGNEDGSQVREQTAGIGSSHDESTDNTKRNGAASDGVSKKVENPFQPEVVQLNDTSFTETYKTTTYQNEQSILNAVALNVEVLHQTHEESTAEDEPVDANTYSEETRFPATDFASEALQKVFLFTGQGAQYHSMGYSLLHATTENQFKTSIHKSNTILQSLGCSWDLITELEGSRVDEGHIAIPASVTLQIALVELLKSRGLSPDIVLGHSTGEIVAAFAAGILSHHDAIVVAYNLGDVLLQTGKLGGKGKMLAVGLGEDDIQLYLERVEGMLEVACTNSDGSTTLSGNSAAVSRVGEDLEKAGVFCREMKINCAYHSVQMEGIREDFGKRIECIEMKPTSDIRFYSSVSGRSTNVFNASYWVDNIASKVIYDKALESLVLENASKLLFIEVGSQPHLQRATRDTLEHTGAFEQRVLYYPTLVRGIDAVSSILELEENLSGYDIHLDTNGLEKQVTNGHGNLNGVYTNGITHNSNSDPGATKKPDLPPLLEADMKILTTYEDLSQKLSSLVAVSSFQIPLERTIADCGLDSHLAMEFKSWISRNYNVSVSIQEILDTSSLLVLAISIMKTSAKHEGDKTTAPATALQVPSNTTNEAQDLEKTNLPEAKRSDNKLLSELPKLPLPDLDDTLEHYYASIEAFGDPEQLAHTRDVIADFKNNEHGQKLQTRLMERVNDPKLDCWLADLYNNSNFLDRNGPLVPFSSFFYTHKLSLVKHTQSERAAVITLAALQYKENLQKGLVEPAELNGQPTCMFLFQYIFNTSRVPQLGSDVMERYSGNDYIVVLRRGRVFKVLLYDGGVKISYEKIKAVFDWILRVADEEMTMVGILTSDDRKVWAKNRESLKSLNSTNAACIDIIEAASFVVCLDDASPEGAPERARHFHFGNGSNRWNDKSVQFIICENGVSGFVGDHSMLDAGTVLGLNNSVSKAIFDHQPDEASVQAHFDANIVEEKPLVTSPEIDKEVARVVQEFNRNTANITHAFTTYTACGGALPRSHKCPPKSFFQLVVVLASRYHFGYNSALWETVSLGNFHKGRVEINQVVRPCVVQFCEAVDDPSVSMIDKRKLLFEAVKSHTSSVMRAVRGRGVDRHLTSLRQMVRYGEGVPAFFEDPVYNRSRPRKIMSHCHETGMAEKGFVLRDPEAVWVHYEVEDESVHFSVTGVGEAPELFCNLLNKAAESLVEILVSV